MEEASRGALLDLAVIRTLGRTGCSGGFRRNLADVGLALISVRGEGEHGGGDVQDEGDVLGLGVVAGQGGDRGAVSLGPGLFWVGMAVPVRARRPASMTSAWSIWLQALKFSPTGRGRRRGRCSIA